MGFNAHESTWTHACFIARAKYVLAFITAYPDPGMSEYTDPGVREGRLPLKGMVRLSCLLPEEKSRTQKKEPRKENCTESYQK